MVSKAQSMPFVAREAIRDGKGPVDTNIVFTPEQTLGKTTYCARMVVKPGSSIGVHAHGPEAEIFYILEGELHITDNGAEDILHPGDSLFTGGGNTHSVENRSGKDVVMFAIIIA